MFRHGTLHAGPNGFLPRRGTSNSPHKARHTSRGSWPASMAWAAVRPPRLEEHVVDAASSRRASARTRLDHSWNSVNRTRATVVVPDNRCRTPPGSGPHSPDRIPRHPPSLSPRPAGGRGRRIALQYFSDRRRHRTASAVGRPPRYPVAGRTSELPLVPATGNQYLRHPGDSDFASIPWPPPQITMPPRQQHVLRPCPATSPVRQFIDLRGQAGDHGAHPRRAPRVQRLDADSISPTDTGSAVDGATMTTGRIPAAVRDLAVGSHNSGPTTCAWAGQSGRGTSRAGNVAIMAGTGRAAGSPTPTRPRIAASPCRIERAVAARITVSRRRPRNPTRYQPAPDGRQSREAVQRMRREFDPRNTQRSAANPLRQ